MITLNSLDLETITPEKLGELLIDAKKAYYTGGKPIMDDHTYDTLEDILKEKSPYHRLFSKVGHPNFDTGFDKKHHVMPMGSQNKVTKFDDLVHYFELKKIVPLLVKGGDGGGFIVEPKCDGISLEIIYKNGELVEAITRGDGLVGDIITQNVVKMKNLVMSLPNHLSCSIRCEIMVTKKDFEKLNTIAKKDANLESGETYSNPRNAASGLPAKASSETNNYSNPRNAAAGLSQRLDSQYSEYCSLYAVDIFSQDILQNVSTELDKIKFLKSLGFTTVDTHLCANFDDIETLYQQFFSEKRKSYPFEIDGLVVKINDLETAQKLGIKNNRPQYQVAYKFPSQSNLTVIKSVTWQVGPLGNITPVAEVEPIELAGAIVTFASLSNYDLIKEKNFNIGDIVNVSRRGDVIPHLENVVTKVTPGHLIAPEVCPICGTKLIVEDRFLKCPNAQNCLGQILGSLRIFCDTLGILGLSNKTIAKLYHAGRIRLPGDFYNLTVNDIKDLENLGEKSAKNIIFQIQSKKTLTLKQIFDAAVIPNFSAHRIQQLISAGFGTPEKLLNISKNELADLPGFQDTLADKVYRGIALRRSWIESILSQVSLQLATRNLKLNNLTFAITGDLSIPRPKFIELIETNGGKFVSAVSKNTSYLLTNEIDSSSSKFVTAKKLNIPIINEEEFNNLLK